MFILNKKCWNSEETFCPTAHRQWWDLQLLWKCLQEHQVSPQGLNVWKRCGRQGEVSVSTLRKSYGWDAACEETRWGGSRTKEEQKMWPMPLRNIQWVQPETSCDKGAWALRIEIWNVQTLRQDLIKHETPHEHIPRTIAWTESIELLGNEVDTKMTGK